VSNLTEHAAHASASAAGVRRQLNAAQSATEIAVNKASKESKAMNTMQAFELLCLPKILSAAELAEFLQY
jgi:hypothetical protein